MNQAVTAILDAIRTRNPIVQAFDAARQVFVGREVAIHTARFRFDLTCACGRGIGLHQNHPQHLCGCGLTYHAAGVIGPALQQMARTAAPTPPARPKAPPQPRTKDLLPRGRR